MRAHLLLPVLGLLPACAQEAGYARAYKMESLQDGVGGPKALAQPGDFILENDRIRLAILDARPSMGPHTSGASLVDADLQRNDPRYSQGRGVDQLAEVFPTVNLNIAQVDSALDPVGGDGTVRILSDGSKGGAAVICTEGPEQSFITLLDALWNIAWIEDRPYFRIRTDYVLEPGIAAVKMKTTAVFRDASGQWPAGADCTGDIDSITANYSDSDLPLVRIALSKGVDGGGLVFGDFYLQGGSTDVFTPDWGFDESVFVGGLLEEDINTFEEPLVVDFLAGTADRVSYGILPADGKMFVPLFTSSQTVAVGASVEPNVDHAAGASDFARFTPGSAFHYERYFGVGRGDVGSVVDALFEARGDATGRIEGFVVEEATGEPISGVKVLAFRTEGESTRVDAAAAPYLSWTTDVGDDIQADGSFAGTLPPGDYELLVHGEGRPDGRRIPVSIKKGGTVSLVLESPRPGRISFDIVDETGQNVPSKLTIFAQGDSPRDPILGDGFIGGEPAHVVFTHDGEGEVILPPGRYTAVASRGLEYELGISEPFTVGKQSAAHLELQVVRAIDTSGWISADFHVHGFRSHDSGVSRHLRATTMAAEGVEYIASTDHDYMTDYRPAIADLGLEPWIAATVGLEVTTIELGHFLGFPLLMDHFARAGGALQWDGLEPQEMIDGIRDLGAPDETGRQPVVFVGHPRDGILGYYDQYGVSHYDTDADGGPLVETPLLNFLSGNALLDPDRFSDDFDALEVLNGKRMEMIRTPLAGEMTDYASSLDGTEVNGMMGRTMAEQQALIDGTAELAPAFEGVVDDWFHMLNMGYRYTALGNSDTHGTTGVESGCPRNWVQATTDDPSFIDEFDVADSVRKGAVVASYGPFLRFWADDELTGPGSMVKGGTHTLGIEVQSASWVDVSRVELYRNAELIQEWDRSALTEADNLNLLDEVKIETSSDAWYVLVAMGEEPLSPVFTPVEIEPIFLEDVVLGALSGVVSDSLLSQSAPIPRVFPIYPYALTNPIWVDADGDGQFTAPGPPEWWVAPSGE